jgi:endonuclease YncB( thermonuclease family)
MTALVFLFVWQRAKRSLFDGVAAYGYGTPSGHIRAGRTITCEVKATDRYGRTVALCRADGLDLEAAMVSAGMAWAFTRYSGDYIAEERAAIGARSGVHAHDCEKPWDWRARNRGDR